MWFSGQIEVSRILKTPLRYFRITISENLKFFKKMDIVHCTIN